MSNQGWTLGPWRARDADVQIFGYNVSIAHCVTTGLPAKANAQLMAAAPDLYAALLAIERSADYGADDNRPLMQAARAALAKARGD